MKLNVNSLKKIKVKIVNRYFLTFCCIFIFTSLTYFKPVVFKASTSKKQIDFPVKSFVPFLTIDDIEVRNDYGFDYVLLSLRNDYQKTITAYAVSSSGSITRHEMIGGGREFIPGSIRTSRYEPPSSSRPKKGIIVVAAVFEDGTVEGSQKYIKQILDARAGTQEQSARIIPILQDALDTPQNVDPNQKWETAKLRIEQLPVTKKGKSFEFLAALHNQKENALNKIKEFKEIQQRSGADRVKHALSHFIERDKRKNILIQQSLQQSQ